MREEWPRVLTSDMLMNDIAATETRDLDDDADDDNGNALDWKIEF